MSEPAPEQVPIGATYHLLRRAQTGYGVGMTPGDSALSTSVYLHVWATDLPDNPHDLPHGQFAMTPENAELLAQALLDSAKEARTEHAH